MECFFAFPILLCHRMLIDRYQEEEQSESVIEFWDGLIQLKVLEIY